MKNLWNNIFHISLYCNQYNKKLYDKVFDSQIFYNELQSIKQITYQNNHNIIKKYNLLNNTSLILQIPIYQSLLGLYYMKYENNGSISTKHYLYYKNKNLYNLCIQKMIQFNMMYKLFYFNLINLCNNDSFKYFDQFIQIFLKGTYDYCWLSNKSILEQNGYWFFLKYIDQYIANNEYKSNFKIEQIKNKFFNMMKQDKYKYYPYKVNF